MSQEEVSQEELCHQAPSLDVLSPKPRVQRSPLPSPVSFAPCDYEPESVDALIAEAQQEIDDLRAQNLEIMTELHAARQRLSSSGRNAGAARVGRVLFGTGWAGSPLEKRHPDLAAKFESAAVVVRAATTDAKRAARKTREAATSEAASIVDAARAEADGIRESSTAEAALLRAKAQATAERLLRDAHRRVTELTTPEMMHRLDQPSADPSRVTLDPAEINPAAVNPAAVNPVTNGVTISPVPPEKTVFRAPPVVDLAGAGGPTIQTPSRERVVPARRRPTARISPPTMVSDTEPEVREERTFAALWEASDDSADADVAKFFKHLPYNDRGLF